MVEVESRGIEIARVNSIFITKSFNLIPCAQLPLTDVSMWPRLLMRSLSKFLHLFGDDDWYILVRRKV